MTPTNIENGNQRVKAEYCFLDRCKRGLLLIGFILMFNSAERPDLSEAFKAV